VVKTCSLFFKCVTLISFSQQFPLPPEQVCLLQVSVVQIITLNTLLLGTITVGPAITIIELVDKLLFPDVRKVDVQSRLAGLVEMIIRIFDQGTGRALDNARLGKRKLGHGVLVYGFPKFVTICRMVYSSLA